MLTCFDIESSISQAPHVPQLALLQDGGEVRFGDIIHEGAVVEDDGAVTGGRDLGMPIGNAEGQRLDLVPSDALVKAGDQRASADGVDGLARDGPRFDGHRRDRGRA